MVSKELEVVKHVYKDSDFEFTIERPRSWLSLGSEDLKLILEISLSLMQSIGDLEGESKDVSQMNLKILFGFMKYSPNVQMHDFNPNLNALSFHEKHEIKNMCTHLQKANQVSNHFLSSRKTKRCRQVTINGQKFWHHQQTMKIFGMLAMEKNQYITHKNETYILFSSADSGKVGSKDFNKMMQSVKFTH